MSDGPDLTDPKNNPLIPTAAGDPVDPLLTPEGNPLIPVDLYPRPAPPAAAAVEVPEAPSVEFVEAVLKKFIDTSSATDYERIKAALKP